MASICISLTVKDVECFFMYLLAICVFLLDKYLVLILSSVHWIICSSGM